MQLTAIGQSGKTGTVQGPNVYDNLECKQTHFLLILVSDYEPEYIHQRKDYMSSDYENEQMEKEMKSRIKEFNRQHRSVKGPFPHEYIAPEILPYTPDVYSMPPELQRQYQNTGPQVEYIPKFGQKQLNDSVLIQWNQDDIQSGYLRHQMDSIDYWTA